MPCARRGPFSIGALGMLCIWERAAVMGSLQARVCDAFGWLQGAHSRFCWEAMLAKHHRPNALVSEHAACRHVREKTRDQTDQSILLDRSVY